LLVQVSPSAAGPCLPTLLACLDTAAGCMDATCSDANAITDDRIEITFPTGTDRQLVLSLHDLDTSDALSALPTTTAPIKLQPSNQTNTSFCATIPDDHVVGTFSLSYMIARGMNDEAPVVATGEYRMSWDVDASFGIQLTTCASDGASACQISGDGTCIQKAAGGDAITVGFRVWIAQKAATTLGEGTTVTFAATPPSGPALPLATSTQRASGQVPLTITKSVLTDPFDVTADFGATTGNFTFSLVGPTGNLTTTAVRVAMNCSQ
jgi:hypothetical protein